MPLFMLQGTYTPQAWAAMAKKPEDREQAAHALIQKAGGKPLNTYFSFGEYDVAAIFEAPDAATAAAIAIAGNSPGHLKAIKTTQLMTAQELMAVMKKAGSLTFRGPTG